MYTITRGDTVSLDLPLSVGGLPYCMQSGTNYILTVKNNLSDPDTAAVVQKALGAGLRLNLPSNLCADFVPIDFFFQTNTQFYFDVQAQEANGAIETVVFDTLNVTTDVTRSTGTSIPIYTTNPPYPGGTTLTVTGSNAIASGDLVGANGITVSILGSTIIVGSTGGGGIGVTSLNGLVNGVALVGTGGISITAQGQTIILSGTAGGGSGGTGTQFSVTGSQPLATANLIGAGGTQVTLSGNIIIVSGGASSGTVTQFQLDSLSGFVTGASGSLAAQIATAAAGVTSLNGQSGALNLVGTGGIKVITNGPTLLFSGDTSISGALAATIAATGQQSWTAAQNNAINLSGNMAATGAIVEAQIVSLSGFVTGASGFLQNQINGLPTAAQLAQTGSNLYTLIVNQSGVFTGLVSQTSGVLQSSITNTGVILYADITGLSGQAVNTYATILALFQTGSTIYNDLVALSGNLIASGALLSAVKVTGSTVIPVANFTGIGGTLVFTSGNTVFISGGAGGGSSAGVSSINGLTNAVTILGTGGITVSIQGQNVLISGDNSISGALTATGVIIEAQINALSGYFTGLIPSFGSFSFLSAIPTGIDTYFVPYQNYLFTTIPIVNVTMETAGVNVNYGVSISGRTTTGFWTSFTDTILDQNLFLDVFVNASSSPNATMFSYLTGIPTGSDTVYFNFQGMTLPSIPRVMATLETSLFNANYPFTISGRSTTGFFALFGDQIVDSGLSLDVTVRG